MSVDVNSSHMVDHPAYRSGSPNRDDLQQRTAPFMNQRYALPIHHAGPQRGYNDSPCNNRHLAARVENTLRRKTPNGTLNAGYDSSGDEPIPPYKHQLLLSESNGARSIHAPFPSAKRTFLQHQQSIQNSSAGPWGARLLGAQYQEPQNPFPEMDSMLHQMNTQHYNVPQYYGQTVPSVIQPSFQYLGPTASGGQGSGQYGPYWYDGTFSPYRPAALRDPRFYHHSAASFAGSLPRAQHAHQANLWQQQPNHAPWMANGLSPFAPPPLNYPGHHVSPLGHGHVNSGSFVPPGRYDTSSASSGQRLSMGWLQSGPAVETEFGSSSPNGQQRDRTFQWALQQYRELLGYIHHTRRQQQQMRAPGQQHAHHQPSFYPKPPRPSAAGSALPSVRPRSEPVGNYDEDPPVEFTHSGSSGDPGTDDGNTPKAQMLSASTDDLHIYGNQHPRRASHDQFSLHHQHLHHPVYHSHQQAEQRASQRSTAPSVGSGHSLFPMATADTEMDEARWNALPPPIRARRALTELTALCSATNWQWTDGIHLGGCLAYGLGDYNKAHKWFTYVLRNDERHLEARSNLAATLLALGCRKEAEENWREVVQAAPNHFEAVEHLVGLLCHDQRSKDAIEVIEGVENALRLEKKNYDDVCNATDRQSECSSSAVSRSSGLSEQSDKIAYDYQCDDSSSTMMANSDQPESTEPGFGSSGYAIPGSDNGRMLALAHAKGNLLYGRGDNGGAAKAFENAVRIALGDQQEDITRLIERILSCVQSNRENKTDDDEVSRPGEPVLLTPRYALEIARCVFPHAGELPGLRYVHGVTNSMHRKQGVSTTSNALLSLAKIYQDAMSNASRSVGISPLHHGVRDILALYYLSLSLQPSPSTANNVGILLASVQSQGRPSSLASSSSQAPGIPGVIPGSGIALALQYYNYGLQLDNHHAHLYTNLGSLLKDIGQLDAAINMYERAVACDGKFDIALANLANAVKDKGRIADAIRYYRRAVEVSPEFAEAVCGLANALNSVCGWQGRGGVAADGGKRDRWHVDENGMLLDAKFVSDTSTGWIKRVVEIVEKQLVEGESWGKGTLKSNIITDIMDSITAAEDISKEKKRQRSCELRAPLLEWAYFQKTDKRWEGARVTRIIERGMKRITWQWYQDRFISKKQRPAETYNRPRLPHELLIPGAPTVLPFHTFTCPMSAKQIRQISQRNGLRISVATLRAGWLPKQVFPPPRPPEPSLRVGYVSSDFNNHPLAHLMQSVFGLHDTSRVVAYCYATTASDNSVHRRQIESEAPEFRDASTWSAERLVKQIVQDGIHILVNLNGYTRGARNEVFAARPAPIQMSFMGFAGTLGAEWCDYLLADETAVPVETLSPHRGKVTLEDKFEDERRAEDNDDWVYGENIIYCRDTFFCCDHKQSAPDAHHRNITWDQEQRRRWKMRKELFPQLSDDTIIFGNFNQLYKIDPTTFRTWLRILDKVPNSILWLLRFPDLGESNLLATAKLWASADVASRVIFTDVAPKHQHISRARICDLVLDTAECNAHTTAADVLWSGTPLLTLPRYPYKMCSRMAASILKGALPKNANGERAAGELIATSEDDYEEKAVALGRAFSYTQGKKGVATGRLMELRKMLFEARWSSALFDTKRWVSDLEDAYDEAWKRWANGEPGDIWLDKIPKKRSVVGLSSA